MRANFFSKKSKYAEANLLQGLRDKISSTKDELVWSKVSFIYNLQYWYTTAAR